MILTMRLPNLAPYNAVLRSPGLRLRTVHKRHALSEVELSRLAAVHAFQREQADVGVGVALSTLVAEVAALYVDCMCELWVRWLDVIGERTAVRLFGGHDDYCVCE